MNKIISFSPHGITTMYLDRIKKDMGNLTTSEIMQRIVSEYFALKYGEDKRAELREVFMKEYFHE